MAVREGDTPCVLRQEVQDINDFNSGEPKCRRLDEVLSSSGIPSS